MASSAQRRDCTLGASSWPLTSDGSTHAGQGEAPVVDVVIDCDTCAVRGRGCPDCMVSFLLDGPPDDIVLDGEEQRALGVLASAGLIPPLRMVQSVSGGVEGEWGRVDS